MKHNLRLTFTVFTGIAALARAIPAAEAIVGSIAILSPQAVNMGAGSASSGNANSDTKAASRRFTARLALMAASHCG